MSTKKDAHPFPEHLLAKALKPFRLSPNQYGILWGIDRRQMLFRSQIPAANALKRRHLIYPQNLPLYWALTIAGEAILKAATMVIAASG